MLTIAEIAIAGDRASWAAVGFAVDDGRCQLGGVSLRLAGADAGRGILGWSLRGVESTELDGLPTALERAEEADAGPSHPNGVTAVDHLVVMSPLLDRTVAALRAAGLDLRRIRDQPTPAGAPRQAFFRLGAEILEVVQQPDGAVAAGGGLDRPPRLWGLAVSVASLD